jgi:hypothetical protein
VTILEDDYLPEETLIGEVPCWAYDMYSREGQIFKQRVSGKT